ncbi:DMT family transporter [Gluconobacter oxydans]|uniref:DMT family transporter n=1 Tax=Gluconobacter oxydans TaxID=442 RepID=UPI0039ECD623
MTHPSGRFLPFFVAVAILSWASAYPVVRIALHDLAPVPLAALRYAVAAVMAALWLLWKRPRRPELTDIPQILACGIIGITVYNILFNCGEMTVSSGAASLLISAAPLMAGLLAMVFLGERMSRWGWAGSILSFSGVALIAKGQSGGLSFGSGATLVFGAAVCAAFYTILQKGLIRRYGALPTIAYVLISGAIFLTPWLPQGLESFSHASWQGQAAVLELGIFPAAFGYAAWGFVIGHLGASRGAALLYLLPPVTMVLAYILTNEVPSLRTLIGGAVVMAGVILTNTYGRHPVAQTVES